MNSRTARFLLILVIAVSIPSSRVNAKAIPATENPQRETWIAPDGRCSRLYKATCPSVEQTVCGNGNSPGNTWY